MYVYLPSYFEKASSAKTTSSRLAPRGTLQKHGKNLIPIFRYSFGDSTTIPPCCPSIPKGMLDNIKTFCYVLICPILSETPFFVHSLFILCSFCCEPCSNTFRSHTFASTVGFDLFKLFTSPLFGFRTFFRYISTRKTPQNQILTTCSQAVGFTHASPECHSLHQNPVTSEKTSME